jgi:hypothetical protein
MGDQLRRRRGRQSDLDLLEELQDRIMQELREKEINPKVGDLLKALELKLKLKLPQDEKAKIWELINQLRKEELSSSYPKKKNYGKSGDKR